MDDKVWVIQNAKTKRFSCSLKCSEFNRLVLLNCNIKCNTYKEKPADIYHSDLKQSSTGGLMASRGFPLDAIRPPVILAKGWNV
jgi:hypothetical protein